MRKTNAILFLLVCSLSVWGQDDVFTSRDIIGTARYTGMAGAMTAVGADPSAVMDNPAGLGLYRRMEVSLTLRPLINTDKQLPSAATANLNPNTKKKIDASCQLPQASIVFALSNNNDNAKMRYCNFMLSYNRLRSYNHTSAAYALNQPSIAGLMCDQAARTGLDENYISTSDFNHPQSGWLSKLGYQAYMIDPTYHIQGKDTTFTGWSANYGVVPETAIKVEESGYMDEYAFDWAANLSNRWYIGLGINLRTLHYNKSLTYSEWFSQSPSQAGMELLSYVHQTGVGVSGSVGLIYHPLRWLRAGLSFQTPVAARVVTKTNAYLNTYNDSGSPDRACETRLYRSPREKLTLPLRSSAGISFLLGNNGVRGLISLQYDYMHWSNMDDIHTLKAGFEIVPKSRLFLQAGYALESRFKSISNMPLQVLTANTVHTDADFRHLRDAHYASLGIGYRGKWFIAQAAYQCRVQTYRQYPFTVSEDFENQNIDIPTMPDSFEHRGISHRIVFTFAWHNR